MAVASIRELSLAFTEMAPAAVKVLLLAAPRAASLRMRASTVLAISLRLTAPVALAATLMLPLAVKLPPTATPKVRARISALTLLASSVTAPLTLTVLLSMAARAVSAMSLIEREMPRPTPTALPLALLLSWN